MDENKKHLLKIIVGFIVLLGLYALYCDYDQRRTEERLEKMKREMRPYPKSYYRQIEGVSPEESERLRNTPKDISGVLRQGRHDIDLNTLSDEEILEQLELDYQDVYDYYGGSEGY